MAVNVLIVEDQDIPRELFEIYIKSSEQFHHLLSISNASAALSVCKAGNVDLILMDVMTELYRSGLDAAEEIKKQFPQIKIIIVTSMPEYSWISRAKEIGVDSFWYKDGQKSRILDVMERTMAGERIFPDETPLIRIGNATNHEFTERELDVLKELTTGDTNAEIADAAFHFGSDGEKPYPAPDGKNGVQDPHRACFRSAGAWDRDQRYKTGIKNTRR